jgi:hypothetical protein
MSMRIQHRSMRGRVVDMEALQARHEKLPAVGNANMNARGDVIGPRGELVTRREQIVQAYAANNHKGVRHVSLKSLPDEVFETPAEAMARLRAEAQAREQQAQAAGPAETTPRRTRKLVDKAT